MGSRLQDFPLFHVAVRARLAFFSQLMRSIGGIFSIEGFSLLPPQFAQLVLGEARDFISRLVICTVGHVERFRLPVSAHLYRLAPSAPSVGEIPHCLPYLCLLVEECRPCRELYLRSVMSADGSGV